MSRRTQRPEHRALVTTLTAGALGVAALGGLGACNAIVHPDTSRLYGGGPVDAAVPPPIDAAVPPGLDAAVPPGLDAAIPPRPDAGSTGTTIAPSNVEPTLLDMGTRDLEIGSASSFDTTECRATSADARVVRQGDGSEACALLVRTLHISSGGTLRVFGNRPLVILASGDVQIEGTLDVSARGPERGPGGGIGGTARSPDGEGVVRGLRGGTASTYGDGGGGGGGLCSPGGRGGNGGVASGGARSDDGMMRVLEPLVGGGGGGLGPGGVRPVPDRNFGLGGGGGGAVQVSARGTLQVSGRVLAGGGAGGAGLSDSSGSSNWGAGGGGGGGGGILLEATTLRISGSASILATGGGGGGGASSDTETTSGQDGRDQAMRSQGGRGGGTYGATGGNGGGGDQTPGLDGGSSSADGGNGGGGGGGAGCIVLRAPGGAMRPSGTTLSPSTTGLSLLPIHTR